MCDKMERVSGLMNGHVRRMFNLEAFVEYVDVTDDDESVTQKSYIEERV